MTSESLIKYRNQLCGIHKTDYRTYYNKRRKIKNRKNNTVGYEYILRMTIGSEEKILTYHRSNLDFQQDFPAQMLI